MWIVIFFVSIIFGFSLLMVGLEIASRGGGTKKPQTDSSRTGNGLMRSDIIFEANHINVGEYFADSAPFLVKFPFLNAGDSPVELAVQACCGSRASFKDEKTLYRPGEKGELIFEFLTKLSEDGQVSRFATVFKKGVNAPIAKLEATATIKRRWRVRPYPIIKFGKVKPGEITSAELMIETGTHEEGGVIRGSKAASPLLKVEDIGQERFNQRKRYKYKVSLKGDTVTRHFESNVVFETTNPKVPEVVLPVSAEFSGLITVLPRSLYLAQVLPGSVVNKTLSIISNNGEPIEILRTSCTKGYMSLEKTHWNEKEKEVKLDFIAKIPEKANGVLRGSIRIECRTSEEFETQIPWIAIVLTSKSQQFPERSGFKGSFSNKSHR